MVVITKELTVKDEQELCIELTIFCLFNWDEACSLQDNCSERESIKHKWPFRRLAEYCANLFS